MDWIRLLKAIGIVVGLVGFLGGILWLAVSFFEIFGILVGIIVFCVLVLSIYGALEK